MKFLVAVLVSMAFISGCQQSEPKQERYQLQTSTDGHVYRLDKISGEVALVSPDGMRIVGAPKDPLGIRGNSKEHPKKMKIGKYDVEEIAPNEDALEKICQERLSKAVKAELERRKAERKK
jgi:hypothetical protein